MFTVLTAAAAAPHNAPDSSAPGGRGREGHGGVEGAQFYRRPDRRGASARRAAERDRRARRRHTAAEMGVDINGDYECEYSGAGGLQVMGGAGFRGDSGPGLVLG